MNFNSTLSQYRQPINHGHDGTFSPSRNDPILCEDDEFNTLDPFLACQSALNLDDDVNRMFTIEDTLTVAPATQDVLPELDTTNLDLDNLRVRLMTVESKYSTRKNKVGYKPEHVRLSSVVQQLHDSYMQGKTEVHNYLELAKAQLQEYESQDSELCILEEARDRLRAQLQAAQSRSIAAKSSPLESLTGCLDDRTRNLPDIPFLHMGVDESTANNLDILDDNWQESYALENGKASLSFYNHYSRVAADTSLIPQGVAPEGVSLHYSIEPREEDQSAVLRNDGNTAEPGSPALRSASEHPLPSITGGTSTSQDRGIVQSLQGKKKRKRDVKSSRSASSSELTFVPHDHKGKEKRQRETSSEQNANNAAVRAAGGACLSCSNTREKVRNACCLRKE